MLNTENTQSRIIQDIRYAGESPYVQYDILDARTLLGIFQATSPHYLNSRRLGRILKGLDMWLIPGLHHVCGRQCRLWTCLPRQPIAGLVAMVRERVKAGAVELHTELTIPRIPGTSGPIEPLPLLPTFERQILALRIQPQGLRYPRPREIAKKMECATFQVNFALQTIRRKLGLKSMKDIKALRAAVKQSGALMDDPAFS